MKTEEILKQIYQELNKIIESKDNRIFVIEYTIPSVNYNENGNIEDMSFASGIKMELEKMMEHFKYEFHFSSYKDKYFFSNVEEIARQKMLQEIETETTKEQKLKMDLNEKVEQEYASFKKELEQKSPKEIIEKAYELVVKEQIKEELKEKNLTGDELKALLKEKDLLSECYEDWRNSDGRLGEVISYTIDDSIEIIEQEYKKENKQKIKESR